MMRSSNPISRAWFGGLLAGILAAVSITAHADVYFFEGTATLVTPTDPDATVDAYTVDQQGSFGDPTVWQNGTDPYVPGLGMFPSSGPGADDSVTIQGYPADYFPPDLGGFISQNEFLGITGNGFQISGVSGTIKYLGIFGPGTLSLGSLTVTGTPSLGSADSPATEIISVGGSPVFDNLDNVLGYDPSAMTISGGTLSTPVLTLMTGTSLAPANGITDTRPDPVADAGSLTISGATLSGDVTKIYGAQGGDVGIFDVQPDQPFVEEAVMLNNATLNAKTELDIVGADPAVFANVTGQATLAASGSTITAGSVVIATGIGPSPNGHDPGYGTGPVGAPAALTLTGSTLNATSAGDNPPSLVVGDTGDGTLTAMSGSTINAQQSVIGNAVGSTGQATIDSSTWNNASFLTIGNFGDGTLTAQNGAKVISSDVMFIGLNGGSTGTLAISGGAAVTTFTTGVDGTNSTVIGTDADSTGTLTVDGSGSQFESKGDTQIGYSGNGTATITGGGAFIVDGTLFRVGRNEGGTGLLTVTGTGSSVTATNATLYVGYGGTGTVSVQDGATLSVMATNIGGQTTGVGTLNIDGADTRADLGDVTVGDAGDGTLNITGATVTTKDITVGAQEGDPVMSIGANAQVMADGDMIVGDQGIGDVHVYDHATLSVNSMMLGNGGTGDGSLTIDTNSTVTSGDTTIATEEGSQGIIQVDGTGSALTINGDLTVGDAGDGTLTVSGNGTVSNQAASVGAQEGSTGTVEVTGQGSIWHSTGDLTIGDSGSGEVTVADGGTLRVEGDLILGKHGSSEGMLTIDGSSTQFIYSGGDVKIGSSGSGTMVVQNSAFVDLSGNSVTLGDSEDLEGPGDGTLVVTDPDSILNTGDLTIGGQGSGTLMVVNGGTLSSGDATIGDEEDADGMATVTGTGSNWTATGLTVGGKGDGTLNIENGGVVTVNNTQLVIGDQPGSTGVITLSGAGSKLNFTGQLQVGEDGTGLFAVQGGASYTGHAVVVGDKADGVGTLNVDGTGTMMEVQTDFNVGEKGNGTLNVTNSAKLLNDGDATLADMALSVATAKIDTGGLWTVNGNLTVGGQAQASLTITGGSMVSAYNMTIGDQGFGTGTVTVTGSSGAGNSVVASTLQYFIQLSVGNSGSGTLNIQNGGKVTFGTPNPPEGGSIPSFGVVDVGVLQDSLGKVDVTGTGSSLNAKNVTIGDNGRGTVTVEQGAKLTTGFTVIGNMANGDGTLKVNGNNTVFSNTSVQAGIVDVGLSGTGEMDVNGGATVTADSLKIGENANSHGKASISGPSSAIQVNGALVVGDQGMGTLALSGGASLTATSTLVGGLPAGVIVPVQDGTSGGVGSITVDGSSTAMTISGDLSIGSFVVQTLAYGTGNLSITHGATVTNQNAVVEGPINSGAGELVVVSGSSGGSASFWHTKGDLTIGQNGDAIVEMDGGAVATVEGNLILGQNIYPAYTVNFGASDGVLELTGNGTTFNENGGTTTIGASGFGSLSVEGAAHANFSSSIVTLGQNASAIGSISVGSEFVSSLGSEVDLNAVVDGDAGSGHITISNGATMVSHASSMILGNQQNSSGDVTLDGALSELMLNSGATVTVGQGGKGFFNVQNNASFTVSNFVLAGNELSHGTADVTGTGAPGTATLLYDDKLIVGDAGTGELDITKGGVVAPSGVGAGAVIVGAQFGSSGTVTVDGAGSHLEATSLVVGGPQSAGSLAFLFVNGGATAHVATSVKTGPASFIDVTGGGLTIGSTSTLAATGSIQINSGGTLGGQVAITGNVVNGGGTVAPGDPATLTVNGNFTQLSGAVLQLAIAGTTSFDMLDVHGNITLGGNLSLAFIDGFAPKEGDVFDFLNVTGTLTGTFDEVQITGLAPGFEYEVQAGADGSYGLVALNDGMATSVPEPASLMLFLLGGAIILWPALNRRVARRR